MASTGCSRGRRAPPGREHHRGADAEGLVTHPAGEETLLRWTGWTSCLPGRSGRSRPTPTSWVTSGRVATSSTKPRSCSQRCGCGRRTSTARIGWFRPPRSPRRRRSPGGRPRAATEGHRRRRDGQLDDRRDDEQILGQADGHRRVRPASLVIRRAVGTDIVGCPLHRSAPGCPRRPRQSRRSGARGRQPRPSRPGARTPPRSRQRWAGWSGTHPIADRRPKV